MADHTTCPLCRQGVESLLLDDVPLEIWTLYPLDAIDTVPNARMLRVGTTVLLHHACASPAAGTDTPYWDVDRAWWACADPTRPLDADTHFDLNCMACAQRWKADGERS